MSTPPPETALDWQAQARCAQADPDAFFPEKGEPAGPALRICDMCPVVNECLNYALTHHPGAGIWGGTTERQRRKMGAVTNHRLAQQQAREAKITQLAKAGWTDREIGNEIGLSKNSVQRARTRLGIEAPSVYRRVAG